jgi:biotin-(acetyl-CoA carboxylase) ligase
MEGSFAGLDAEGALMIADKEGRVRRFTYGDVTLANASPTGAAQEENDSP